MDERIPCKRSRGGDEGLFDSGGGVRQHSGVLRHRRKRAGFTEPGKFFGSDRTTASKWVFAR